MKGKTLGIFAFVFCIVACSKDKFQTKPKLTLKAYNTKTLSPGQELVISYEYTDKEGDLADGKLVYSALRLNAIPYDPSYPDSVETVLSNEIPNKNKGEIDLRLLYINLHRSDAENDTIQIRTWLVDAAGNRSDTLKSDQLVILTP